VYVDVGCNLGYFAAQAASLGAHVDCFEPTPPYTAAIRQTIALNGFSSEFNVSTAAVAAAPDPVPFVTGGGYMPCGIGAEAIEMERARHSGGRWSVPRVDVHRLLRGRRIELLKLDIDSIEGAPCLDAMAQHALDTAL
jgi:FkbM family methyltransferase